MGETCPPADGVPKGVAVVRGYRVERAAMRAALRIELRAARASLTARRLASRQPAAPDRPASDRPASDGLLDKPTEATPRDTPPREPLAELLLAGAATGGERAEPADAETSILSRLLQTVDVSPLPDPLPDPLPGPLPGPAPEPAPNPLPEPTPEPAPGATAPGTPPTPEPPAPEPPPPSLPLARLGFGDGMLARLNQLGIHDTADLAATAPASLREALGEISRLVDVDAWVAHARASLAGQ